MNLLRCLATHATVAVCLMGFAVPAAHAVTIDWVTVGDPGNAADTTGFGAVTGAFQIMTFEFTNSQYATFLNAIDPDGTNPNSIYNGDMGSNVRGGITNTGTTSGSRYAVKPNMGDKPVNYVSWFQAARVANWVNNGAQTYGTSDATATAPQNIGAYTLGTATSGTTPARNLGAIVWIPTENEWYKAAYYKGGSTNAGYWDYATLSDSVPTAVTADSTGTGSAGSIGNFANYNNAADWNSLDGNVTTAGTNGSASAYGTFDQGGSVWEWNDLSSGADTQKGRRGGSWSSTSSDRLAANFGSSAPLATNVGDDMGFRLAAVVPEPSSFVLAAIAASLGVFCFRRRRGDRSAPGQPSPQADGTDAGLATPG